MQKPKKNKKLDLQLVRIERAACTEAGGRGEGKGKGPTIVKLIHIPNGKELRCGLCSRAFWARGQVELEELGWRVRGKEKWKVPNTTCDEDPSGKLSD